MVYIRVDEFDGRLACFLSKTDGLVIWFHAPTDFSNMVYVRILTINWKWPFLHSVAYFHEPGEDKYWVDFEKVEDPLKEN